MRFIYNFKQGEAEGNRDMRDLLGGKGANLAEMCNLSIPVPPGFTIIPEASKFFVGTEFDSEEKFNFNIQYEESLHRLEQLSNSVIGSESNPCLLSVRSGAKHSMPGMMDSVLNLGMNDYLIDNFIEKTGNPFYVYDCYRRFIQTYAVVVLNIDPELFEEKLECLDNPTFEDLKNLCEEFKQILVDKDKHIPSNGYAQLRETIKAVYLSWDSDRAKIYRQEHNIPEGGGTAVNIQTMVYGNKNENSLTGVLFSRDCLSGSDNITGEFLYKSQGEDIVSGLITPDPLSIHSSKEIARKIGYPEEERLHNLLSLEEIQPSLFKTLSDLAKKLETHYKDAQDIEFTVDDGELWILQTRVANKTRRANYIIQKSLFLEDIIDYDILQDRTKRYKLEKPDRFSFKDLEEKNRLLLGIGLAASSGLAVGQIALDSERALKQDNAILVREQTDTHDLEGILASKGTLTAKGGTTSHAAVVCRGANLCCVVGAKILVDLVTRRVQIGDKIFNEGDWISLDGDSGEIYAGQLVFEV